MSNEPSHRECADAEHQMLRAELLNYESSRISIVAFAGSGVGIILSIAMSGVRTPLERGLIALASLGVVWPPMLLIASRVRAISRITAYLRVVVEPHSTYSWETRLDRVRRMSAAPKGSGWSSFRTIVPRKDDLGGWGGVRDVSPLLALASVGAIVAEVCFAQAAWAEEPWGAVFGLLVLALLVALVFRGPMLAGLSSVDEMRERYEGAWRQLLAEEQTAEK